MPHLQVHLQAAYKIGSQQTVLSLQQQGKLKDDTRGALFPSIEERKRQANAARTLSDVFENSIGVALQSQIHKQLGPLASAGLELDSVCLQEDLYAHAARSFVG
jgi:hypothetical protein